MLKYVMKLEKEVTEIVFCKDIQALSPTLCAGKTMQKTVHTPVWQKQLHKNCDAFRSAKQPMLIPRLLCGAAT